MNHEIERTELMCSICGRATEQEIAYAGRLMVSARCLTCGNEIHVARESLPEEYKDDLLDRLRSKPHRLAHRLRKHPWRVLRSLPGAIVRQPYKLLTELRTIRLEKRRLGEERPGPP